MRNCCQVNSQTAEREGEREIGGCSNSSNSMILQPSPGHSPQTTSRTQSAYTVTPDSRLARLPGDLFFGRETRYRPRKMPSGLLSFMAQKVAEL